MTAGSSLLLVGTTLDARGDGRTPGRLPSRPRERRPWPRTASSRTPCNEASGPAALGGSGITVGPCVVARPMASTAVDLDLRPAAMRLGSWLGWASILAVLAGLALDIGARHRWLLFALTLVAAAA